MADSMPSRKRSRKELSAQCIVFKKHYVELEATLEAHPLAGILFSQEVISDHELQEIHGATTPFRKNELLLKYLLKSEKDVIPLILDTLKKEPAMEFQHTLIENAFKEASETESESEIEETYTINVAQAFVTSVLHLFHKHTNTDIEMFRVNANTFAKLKGFGISISVPRSSGIYNNLGPSTQMLRSLTFEAEVQIKDDIWIQISEEFADLLIGLNEILSINDKALQNIKQGFKFSSHLPVEGIDNVATISDLLEYIHPVKKNPYSYVDTDLLALTVKFSKDKEAQQLLETFWTCHPPIIHTMDLYLNPVQTHESNNENGCLVPVTVTCCDSTISWNSLKQKKEALCIAFKLPQFALRFSKVSKGSIVIVWEMASNLANIVCSDSIGQECLEMLSQVRIAEIKIGSMLILSIPPLRALQKDDRTPLFTAALYGNEDVVRYLLSQILVNKVDKQQTSALDIAIENEQWNIVELLVTAGGIQGIDAASKVEQLLESCKSGNVFIAKEALQSMIDIDTKNEEGDTALFIAVCKADLQLTKFLIHEGAEVNIVNKGKSLLEVAIERKLWDIVSVLRKSGGMDAAEISDILFNASQQGDIMAVERVLRTGVNINSKNKDGETALMLAAHFEQPSIIDLLLFYDADLGMINKARKSAFDIATEFNSRISREILVKCNAPRGEIVCLELHNASKLADIAVVKRAIARGVPVDYRSSKRGTSIMMASLKGHAAVVETLLTSGACINAQDQDGFTAIMAATANNHCHVVHMLLKSGGDPNLKSTTGCSALYLASENGFIEIVKELVHNGADVDIQDKDGTTPLSIACQMQHCKIVQVLLEGQSRANVDMPKNDGSTALFPAVYCSNHEIIQSLIKGGSSVNSIAMRGFTVLFIASERGDLQVVKMLIEAKADVNIKAKDNATCLYLASQNEHHEVVFALISAGADVNAQLKNGVTPLFIASQMGNKYIVKMLLDAKCDANLQTVTGATPLYVASGCGHVEIVQLLLGVNASTNLHVEDGTTALHIACYKGFAQIVKYLLDSGANGDLQTKSGATPLHIATQRHMEGVVSALLEAHVDVNLAREDGDTPLHIASENGFYAIAEKLITNGADVNVQMTDGYAPLHFACQNGFSDVVQILLNDKADVNTQNEEGLTPLHIACQQGHLSIVQLLLQVDTDINVKSNNGLTAVMMAVIFKHTPILEELLHLKTKPNLHIITSDGWSALMLAASTGNHDATRVLIMAGAPINQEYQEGLTPLMHAVLQNNTEIARCLMDAKAKIEVKIKPHGWTPLMIAAANSNLELVSIFIRRGADVNVIDENGCRAIELSTNQDILDALKKGEHADMTPRSTNSTITRQGITAKATICRTGAQHIMESGHRIRKCRISQVHQNAFIKLHVAE